MNFIFFLSPAPKTADRIPLLADCGRSKHDTPSGGIKPPPSGGQQEEEDEEEDEGFFEGIANDIGDWFSSWFDKKEASAVPSYKQNGSYSSPKVLLNIQS